MSVQRIIPIISKMLLVFIVVWKDQTCEQRNVYACIATIIQL
jgi:hypothetical protein